MRKLIFQISLFVFGLILMGVGCAQTQPQKTNEELTQTPPREATKLDEALTEKQPEVNVKTHYPSFVPEGLEIDKNSISLNEGTNQNKITTYTLGKQTDASSDEPWIMIQEQNNSSEELANNLTPDEIPLENLNGYALATEGRLGKFYQVVFTTRDNTLIRITSKKFDTETLIKIAESM